MVLSLFKMPNVSHSKLPTELHSLWLLVSYRKDWGALILVDERFGKGFHYTRGLLITFLMHG